jgi:phage shock protein C
MTCTNCQKEIPDYSNFCNCCGSRQQVAGRAYKRLLRSSVDRKIAGVCGGIAEYLEVDSTVVRLAWLLLLFIPVPIVFAVVAYFVAWLVMPQAPAPVPNGAAPKSATSPPAVPGSAQPA